MAKYVRIHSTVNITVTPGLQYQDVTNPQAQVADRLKINPLWAKSTVDIKEGSHLYPVEIKKWSTVKALADEKVITIGEEVDKPGDEPEVEKVKENLDRNLDEMKKRQTLKKLKELAGDSDNVE